MWEMEGASEDREGEESLVRLRVGLTSEEERVFIYNGKEGVMGTVQGICDTGKVKHPLKGLLSL